MTTVTLSLRLGNLFAFAVMLGFTVFVGYFPFLAVQGESEPGVGYWLCQLLFLTSGSLALFLLVTGLGLV